MICDMCGENDAVVNLTFIGDGMLITWHLCDECAKIAAPDSDEAGRP
jgi:protein-arginine kinase activator protein McsA